MSNAKIANGVDYRIAGLIPCLSALLLVCSSLGWGIVARADYDELIDSPMYRLPTLPVVRETRILPENAIALWSRALQGPDTELKCRAAQTIVLAKHRGFKGLEAAIPALLAACDKSDQPLAVRLSVARALIELDAKQAADSLFRQAQVGDSDLRSTIEPTLARWDCRPAREMWLSRLREPATLHRNLVLAIRGLAAVGEKKAADRLLEIVLDKQAGGSIRIEAARALGTLRTEGLQMDAERLAAEASLRAIVSRLAAAWMLRQHRSPEAIRILQKLAQDAEPTVAAVAVARLLEIDPDLLVPALKDLLANPDAAIRSFAVDVLHRRPTEKHLRLLCERLDDEHIQVRRKARRFLLELAGQKHSGEQIIADATTLLKTERWRGLEQATILLTQLDQKRVAGRLVELLRMKRPEVKVTAAWGLRKLDVPETLSGVVRYLEDDINPQLAPKAPTGGMSGRRPGQPPPAEVVPSVDARDHTNSQLHQFIGQRKYREADRLLRRFIPKGAFGFPGECRAAAIWALGMIWEDKPDETLVKALEQRLLDRGTSPPEDFRVMWMSGIALGRMKAKDTLASLRLWCPQFKPTPEPISTACGWAIEQITGKKMPPPKDLIKYRSDWFLLPDNWGVRSTPSDATWLNRTRMKRIKRIYTDRKRDNGCLVF